MSGSIPPFVETDFTEPFTYTSGDVMHKHRNACTITLMHAGIVCLAVLLLLTCGCLLKDKADTEPAETIGDIIEETVVKDKSPVDNSDLFIPQPTDAVPAGYEVETTIRKEPIIGGIIVTINGGKGFPLLQTVEVTVVRSDGSSDVISVSEPTMNCDISIMGTKDGIDRVIITKTYSNGATYITDDMLISGREIRTGGQSGGGGGGGGCSC
jgi:hypothetical protein